MGHGFQALGSMCPRALRWKRGMFKEEKGQGSWTLVNGGPEGAEAHNWAGPQSAKPHRTRWGIPTVLQLQLEAVGELHRGAVLPGLRFKGPLMAVWQTARRRTGMDVGRNL